MSFVNIGLEGLDDALRDIDDFEDKARERVLRNAARSGGRYLAKRLAESAPRPKGSARSSASRKYGPLDKNIKSTEYRGRNGKRFVVVSTGAAFWGRFLESGTGKFNVDPGPRAKRNAARTHLRPTYWFSRTVDCVTNQVVEEMFDNAATSLGREVDKFNRKRRG